MGTRPATVREGPARHPRKDKAGEVVGRPDEWRLGGVRATPWRTVRFGDPESEGVVKAAVDGHGRGPGPETADTKVRRGRGHQLTAPKTPHGLHRRRSQEFRQSTVPPSVPGAEVPDKRRVYSVV